MASSSSAEVPITFGQELSGWSSQIRNAERRIDGVRPRLHALAVGGTAVAVASDEAGRSGKPDKWKRNRLIGVGADVVVPDYGQADQLINYLWRTQDS